MPVEIEDILTNQLALCGYLIVFLGVFFESIFLTGWLAPGTAVILLGSFFAAQGYYNVVVVWVVALAGALAGDSAGFGIGLKGGDRLLKRYGDRWGLSRGVDRSEAYFKRYGGVTVIFGRMVSGIDAFIPVTAGLSRMPYSRYMLFDVPGAVLWTGILTALGYFFGDQWERIEGALQKLGLGSLVLLALVVTAAVGVRLCKRRRERIRPQ